MSWDSSVRLCQFCLAATLFAVIQPCLAQDSKSFQAYNLNQLLQRGLVSYPTVLFRQANRDAAETDLLAAKLKFLPNASFNTQRNNVRFDGGLSGSMMPATNATVSQPLLLDGGIIAGHGKAQARLSSADYAILETSEDIGKRIVNQYAEWLRAWLKIKALEDGVRLHKRLAEMISRRFEQGVASGSEKDLGISRLMQIKSELDTQYSVEATALNSLTELVGEPINRGNLVGAVATNAAIPHRNEGIARAQLRSVTVKRLQYDAEAAEQEAKEVRAQALPQLSLQAQRQIGNAYYPGAQGFNTVGLVVSYTPGGGLSNIVGASAAFERARASQFQVETAKRELVDRLNADYNEFEFAKLKGESLQHAAELSRDIAGSFDRQYLVGRKSWLDLMNSVREQVQVQVQMADIKASLLASSHRLLIQIDGPKFFENLNP